MSKLSKNRKVMFTATAVALVALFILSCAPEATPPTTTSKPEVFRIYSIMDVTGPYGPLMGPGIAGTEDFVKYVNEQGGIDGVRYECPILDTQGKLPLAISIYGKVRAYDPKPVAVATSVSTDNEALRERFAEDHIVCVSAAASPRSLYPPGWIFTCYPDYASQFGAFLDWMTANWKEGRPPKLAILTWDNAFGRGVLTDKAKAYAKKKGVEWVTTEFIPVVPTDTTTQLIRIKDSGADWIYYPVHSAALSVVLKDAERLGMREGLKLCGIYNSVDQVLLKLAGPKLAEGLYAVEGYCPIDAPDIPAAQFLREQFIKNGHGNAVWKDANWQQDYCTTWSMQGTMVELVRRVVADVGWDNLTGDAVKKEAIKITEPYEVLGGVAIINYGEARRCPNHVRIAQVQDGKLIPVTNLRDTPAEIAELSDYE